MKIQAWYKKRGMRFILERARGLLKRYSISPRKSMDRIEKCVASLRKYDCLPTFAVPGMVVQRNARFIKQLQESGIEITVHGYNHIDFLTIPAEEGARQLQKAVEVFRGNNLEVRGFRCPYLSASDDLLKAIPPGLFEYSSNKAVQWPKEQIPSPPPESNLYATIERFYQPASSACVICLPENRDHLVEIPACVPDDLQLHDGYGFGAQEISQIWMQILHQTHLRGEVFDLMFHPELASFCEAPFLSVLEEARSLRPKVWLAQLRDISSWWKEKSNFSVEAHFYSDHSILKFHCTPRATILYRGFDANEKSSQWDHIYRRLESDILTINGPTLPLIRLLPGTPQWVSTTLQEMGYILSTDGSARQCSIFIDEHIQKRYRTPVELVDYIENTHAPLVRFWPWPDGSRSALCISGDLDALSLFDYAFRLLKI